MRWGIRRDHPTLGPQWYAGRPGIGGARWTSDPAGAYSWPTAVDASSALRRELPENVRSTLAVERLPVDAPPPVARPGEGSSHFIRLDPEVAAVVGAVRDRLTVGLGRQATWSEAIRAALIDRGVELEKEGDAGKA